MATFIRLDDSPMFHKQARQNSIMHYYLYINFIPFFFFFIIVLFFSSFVVSSSIVVGTSDCVVLPRFDVVMDL